VTWNYDDGVTRLYFDGQQKTPFWKNNGGTLDDKPASQGGVDPALAAKSARSQTGSLVLGQVGCWGLLRLLRCLVLGQGCGGGGGGALGGSLDQAVAMLAACELLDQHKHALLLRLCQQACSHAVDVQMPAFHPWFHVAWHSQPPSAASAAISRHQLRQRVEEKCTGRQAGVYTAMWCAVQHHDCLTSWVFFR
jgi:hypothetical protein